MDSFTVSDCDNFSTVEKDPEDNNERSAATDDSACVIRDTITVERKRRSKDRMLTSTSQPKFDTLIGVTSMLLHRTVYSQQLPLLPGGTRF
jgi:hypothetical protein